MNQTIFIIDDEPSICVSLQLALKHLYRVRTFNSSLPALAALESEGADMVLLDLRLGEESGLDVLQRIKKLSPYTEVIMMTAFGSIDSSVNAMKSGAFTYLTKPINMEEMKIILQQAGNIRRLNEQVHYMSDVLESRRRYETIVGESPAMQRVYMLIDRVKDIDNNVLICGESGTGKELAARAIHEAGKRREERFVRVNCTAIPENLLELELFGYKRGVFTGAEQDKKGKLEQAAGGTLFLDEIGGISPDLQGKLLNALENREITPVGGDKPVSMSARVIASTNRDLLSLVERGEFREDLYYLLKGLEIRMPALREREGDVPRLCGYFLEKYAKELNKPLRSVSAEAMEALNTLPYPGNVRQLANILEYASILCQTEEIGRDDLPEDLSRRRESRRGGDPVDEFLSGSSMRDIELRAIRATLDRCGGKRSATAESLGISKRGLLNKLKEFGIAGRGEEEI